MTDRTELLLKVSTLHYIDRISKTGISHQLGVSATQVANLIKEAHKAGIVKIAVELPSSTTDSLVQQIRRNFRDAAKILEDDRAKLLSENEHIATLYERMQNTDYDFLFIGCGPLRNPYSEETTLAALEYRGLKRSTLENAGIVGNLNYVLVN